MRFHSIALAKPTTLNRLSDDQRDTLPAGLTGTAHRLDVSGMEGLLHLNVTDDAGAVWTGHALPSSVDLGPVVATTNEG